MRTSIGRATVAAAILGACITAWAADEPAPRSDGSVLHVDFEGYEDGLVGILDAGVRWLGHPFSDIPQNKVEILDDEAQAYAGRRCAYVLTDKLEQCGRIMLQRRFDASEVDGEVMECVYRPVRDGAADLEDFVVWSTGGYRSGDAGLKLYANGRAADGTYALDLEAGSPPVRTAGVLKDLKQTEWLRLVLARDRERKTVDLWAGPPTHERWVGRYDDLGPGRAVGRVHLGDLTQDRVIGSGCWDEVRVGRPLAEGAAPVPGETLRHVGDELPQIAYPLPVGAEKQLFADDTVVESMEGVQRTFHAPVKRPENPLLVPQERWEVDGTFFVPFDVLRNSDGKLRTWYGCYRKSANKLTYTCVAESADGLRWERPRYGLFEFEGAKDNNIVWEGRGVKPNFDPRDPDPARRYKGMMRADGFAALFSPDGIHWSMGKEQAIEQAYDASTVHWDPVGGKWLASCKMFKDGKRARGYAESADYVNWTDTYPMLHADERDAPEDQLYAMRIMRYESIYVGMLKVYHVATDRCDIQLAFSRNGRHWERPHRGAFLSNSTEPGVYDYGNLDEAGEPVRIGDELWFFYGGRSILHNEPPQQTAGSLCAATLRLDGFVSLDAGGTEGEVLTRPLLLEGTSLYVNADAKNGEIRVEVLEGDAAADANVWKPVEGFAESGCVPVRSDGVRERVTWNGTTDIAAIGGKPVRLRFHLKNASLYAFWTE